MEQASDQLVRTFGKKLGCSDYWRSYFENQNISPCWRTNTGIWLHEQSVHNNCHLKIAREACLLARVPESECTRAATNFFVWEPAIRSSNRIWSLLFTLEVDLNTILIRISPLRTYPAASVKRSRVELC
jgi:hypothetical protein